MAYIYSKLCILILIYLCLDIWFSCDLYLSQIEGAFKTVLNHPSTL